MATGNFLEKVSSNSKQPNQHPKKSHKGDLKGSPQEVNAALELIQADLRSLNHGTLLRIDLHDIVKQPQEGRNDPINLEKIRFVEKWFIDFIF